MWFAKSPHSAKSRKRSTKCATGHRLGFEQLEEAQIADNHHLRNDRGDELAFCR